MGAFDPDIIYIRVHTEAVGIQKKVPGGDMSINKYDEQKFWEEVDILFPDIVKAITSLAKKSYISITNLRNGVTWWSEKAMEYFGMQENYTIRGQEKSKRSIHSDDLEDFRRGFQERVAGKNMDEPWEYRVRDGSTYNRISARARMLNDKDGKPFVIVIRYNNYGISDEVDATTGLHTEPALDREIREFQFAARNFEVHVLEVVNPGAQYFDRIFHFRYVNVRNVRFIGSQISNVQRYVFFQYIVFSAVVAVRVPTLKKRSPPECLAAFRTDFTRITGINGCFVPY